MTNPITIVCEDEITHTAENGYECNDPDCICRWSQATAASDDAPEHPFDCRCAWCEPPYTRADAERDSANAAYYDQVAQERNATRQCGDGSWW